MPEMENSPTDPRSRDLVPTSPTSPRAYRHAPTLMAAVQPGAQGEVRVWSPDAKRPWLTAVVWTAVAVLSLLTLLLLILTQAHIPLWMWMSHIFLFCGVNTAAACSAIVAWRRLPYFTTDDAGIGITLRRGSIPLRWSEILNVNLVGRQLGITALTPEGVQSVNLELIGYRKAGRQQLFQHIIEKARLAPADDAWYADVCVRMNLSPAQKRSLKLIYGSRYVRAGAEYVELCPRLKDAERTQNIHLHFGAGDVVSQGSVRLFMRLLNRIIRSRWYQRRARARLQPAEERTALAPPASNSTPEPQNNHERNPTRTNESDGGAVSSSDRFE